MTFIKRSIDATTAERAIAAAAEKATEMKIPMCIAIVDESGDLKAFRRMDGAPKLSVEISQNKAYTAACFGMATHAWYDFIKDDAPLLHGIPIQLEGGVVGAIGVSGGHYSHDMEVARAALAAIGAEAK
jgi:uncharacterized protein GlcG (DUF336 family)